MLPEYARELHAKTCVTLVTKETNAGILRSLTSTQDERPVAEIAAIQRTPVKSRTRYCIGAHRPADAYSPIEWRADHDGCFPTLIPV
jgi:isocitrate dehydrogenase